MMGFDFSHGINLVLERFDELNCQLRRAADALEELERLIKEKEE